MRALLLIVSLLATVPSAAQVAYPPGVTAVNGTPPDASGNVTVVVPVAASALPPTEGVVPTIGTAGTYRPADSVPVRITRAGSCVTVAGVCAITWATALPSAPNVILQPVNAGSQPMTCNPTAAPTTTSVSIKCWVAQTTTLSLAIVTTGLNLAPAAVVPDGTVVMATAIPKTQ